MTSVGVHCANRSGRRSIVIGYYLVKLVGVSRSRSNRSLMRVALVVPPFIPVPPRLYGGTELFAAHLAEGLANLGIDVVLYTIGESTLPVERRWMYPKGQWPLE